MDENNVINLEEEISWIGKNSVEERLAVRSVAADNEIFVYKTQNSKYMIVIYPKQGNNIAIECNEIEQVNNYIEKIQLNMLSASLNEKDVVIKSTSKNRVTLSCENMYERIDIAAEDELLQKYNNLREIYGLPTDDFADFDNLNLERYKLLVGKEDEIQSLKDEIIRLSAARTQYVLTDIDSITINGRPLEKTRDAANTLIENANVSENPNEKLLDFDNAGYSNAIQDYLAKFLYDKEFELPEELKEALFKYKLDGFMPFNNFMRGNFKQYEGFYKGDYSVEKMIESLIKIDAIAKRLPKRKHDIMISRIGNGVNKSIEIGSTNMYDSFVSFGTNGGTAIGGNKLVYKRVCKADEPVIPVELVATDVEHPTECEIVTLPFIYEVVGYKEREKRCNIVEMGNIRPIDTIDIIQERLFQFQEWLEENKSRIEEQKRKIEYLNTAEGKKIFESRGYDESKLQEEQIDLQEIIDGYSKTELETIRNFNSRIDESKYQYDSDIHGANHTKRVAFFVRTLAKLGNLSDKDRNVLLIAAEFHDIGREHDYEDKSHGEKSIEVLNNNKISHGDAFNKDLVEFLISQHSKSKEENEQALLEVKESKRERYEKLLGYFKDADKLDRVRLGKEDGLDASRLTMPESRKLVKAAYQAHECLFDMLEVKTREEKINQMHDETKVAIESFEAQKAKVTDVKIETSDLVCFDDGDGISSGVNPEELLEKTITRSEKTTKFSKITSIVKGIRDKILSRDKTKDIKTPTKGVEV